MDQVGHEDASTTLEIYARVLKRRDRGRLGEAFDRLMRDAVPAREGDHVAAVSGG